MSRLFCVDWVMECHRRRKSNSLIDERKIQIMHVFPLQQRYWVDKISIGKKKGVYEPKKNHTCRKVKRREKTARKYRALLYTPLKLPFPGCFNMFLRD